MDDATLQSLVSAYGTAPSPDLAKVIVYESLKRDDLDTAAQHAAGLDDSLAPEELTELTNALLGSSRTTVFAGLLSNLGTENVSLVIQLLLDAGEKELGRELYIQAKASRDNFRSPELDQIFDLSEGKARLRVVEKPDLAEVTDMSRYKQATTDFSDVVGLESIKKQIDKKIIMPFQKPGLFQKFRKKIGGGVLLYGPPGCGKTLLARATAGQCNASFFNVEISDVLDMYIGESEQKLHSIFEKARQETPSVLFFDEMEALAGKREHARNSASSHVISQFLTELDGFSQQNSGVLVLASTNVPWAIDPAFLRPGRFDRMFFVPPPDKQARAAILEHHMHERPSTSDIDYKVLAAACGGYSGADLANLVEMAADEAIEQSLEEGRETPISQAHFKEALGDARATTTEWLTTARNYARYANDGGRYDDVLAFIKKHGK
jgi:ATP-dependent 26S proteasome regulatory subunit